MASIANLLSLWGKVQKFLGISLEAGLPETFFQQVIDDREFRGEFIAWVDRRLNANPFELSVEDTLAALRRASDEERWDISEEVFTRLATTAPAWPQGRDAFRSLRIRFGEGDRGVAATFECHAARIKRVFEGKYWRWEYLLSGVAPYKGDDVERLRLLSGNDTHKPVIEWVIVNLDANRQRQDITSVRGPQSLADEGLVLAWLFPDRVKVIDYDKWPGFFLAGYELNVPERDGGAWLHVPCVFWNRDSSGVGLSANRRDNSRSGYSVPLLRE